jgi:hypothetical protein
VSLDILATGDDRDALTNLRDILGLDGHRVTGAGTPQEATPGRDRPEFCIIPLDRKLPDGSAVALLLREGRPGWRAGALKPSIAGLRGGRVGGLAAARLTLRRFPPVYN